jgi:hypothetical protein
MARPKQEGDALPKTAEDFEAKAAEYDQLADAAASPEAKKRFKDLAQECRNFAKAADPISKHAARDS